MKISEKFSESEQVNLQKIFLQNENFYFYFKKFSENKITTTYTSFSSKNRDPKLYARFMELYIEEVLAEESENIQAIEAKIKNNQWDLPDGFANNSSFVLNNLIADFLDLAQTSREFSVAEIDNFLELVEYRNQLSKIETKYFEERYRTFLTTNLEKIHA